MSGFCSVSGGARHCSAPEAAAAAAVAAGGADRLLGGGRAAATAAARHLPDLDALALLPQHQQIGRPAAATGQPAGAAGQTLPRPLVHFPKRHRRGKAARADFRPGAAVGNLRDAGGQPVA